MLKRKPAVQMGPYNSVDDTIIPNTVIFIMGNNEGCKRISNLKCNLQKNIYE